MPAVHFLARDASYCNLSCHLTPSLQVSEKLPDQDILMTPFRYLVDIHQEFVEDLRAAGIAEEDICARAWFSHIFAYHPELRHVTIASGKENFGRCTTCAGLEQKIADARKKG